MSKLRSAARTGLKALGVVVVLAGAPLAGTKITHWREAAAAPAASAAAIDAGVPAAPAGRALTAVLLPPQMASLQPRSDGRILAVNVKLGQTVKTDAVLVQFDPREKREDLKMAEAQFQSSKADATAVCAQAQSAAAKAKMQNGASVTVGGKKVALVSQLDQIDSLAQAKQTSAQCSAAGAHIHEQKAKVDQLRVALEETELRAPYDGVVTAINFEVGMTVHPGDTVARVVGGVGLRVRIAVPEAAHDLVESKRVRIPVDGQTLFATIDQRGREVEPASRAFLVEGNVELPPGGCGGDCAMLAGRAVHATLLKEP